MRVLLLGADGFVGHHVEAELRSAGHTVVRGTRRPASETDIAIDFRRDTKPEVWRARLDGAGIDAVVNAVGILNETRAGDFELIHHRAPAALFAACAACGIRRIVQISALGAEGEETHYLASKAAGDRALLAHAPAGVVLRPSLIFGADGRSSRSFLRLASLPLTLLPGNGQQRVQPIHIDDLSRIVRRAIEHGSPAGATIAVPGADPVSYRDMLASYRRAMGYAPALQISVAAPLMAAAAWLGDRFAGSLFNRATWIMLQKGSTASPAAALQLLGRPLRPLTSFIAGDKALALRETSAASWRAPLLRGLVAFLWLWSAAVSLLWPDTGLRLLEAFGAHGGTALALLGAASALDAALGILTLARPSARLWLAQGIVIVAYTLLIAWHLPEFLIHPFAPIVKNLFVIGALFLLWSEEKPQ